MDKFDEKSYRLRIYERDSASDSGYSKKTGGL